MKKILSMCLVLILVVSMFSSAFADEIIIPNNPNPDVCRPLNDSPGVKPVHA